jgi:hypothetical protein
VDDPELDVMATGRGLLALLAGCEVVEAAVGARLRGLHANCLELIYLPERKKPGGEAVPAGDTRSHINRLRQQTVRQSDRPANDGQAAQQSEKPMSKCVGWLA